MQDEQLIRTPEDLRPGDLFLGDIGGWAGIGVRLGHMILNESFEIGDLKVLHAAILTENARGPRGGRRLAQSMPRGAEVTIFDERKHWNAKCAWVRLPEDYPGQALDAAAVALEMVNAGVSYSPLSYLSLAAYRFGVRQDWLLKWINRRRPAEPTMKLHGPWPGQLYTPQLPVEAICSVFVDQAWTLAGKSVIDNPEQKPQAVTPGALAGRLHSFPGATWAIPLAPGKVARSWIV